MDDDELIERFRRLTADLASLGLELSDRDLLGKRLMLGVFYATDYCAQCLKGLLDERNRRALWS